MKLRHLLVWMCGAVFVPACMATSCMVIGQKDARVQSSEGERSPVFQTQSCESLRLITGKAMVTWFSRDGKPNFSAITENGPLKLPSAGAEERSGNAVWAELTSKRETQRSASMRAIGDEKPARIYVPVAGLELPSKPGANLRILVSDSDGEKQIFETKNAAKVHLSRDLIKPGASYTLEWSQDDKLDLFKWQTLSASEITKIDAQLVEIQATVTDENQRRVVSAMLFEQLKLHVNAGLALSSDL